MYLFAVVVQFHIEALKKQRELRGVQVSAMGSLFHFRSNAPSLKSSGARTVGACCQVSPSRPSPRLDEPEDASITIDLS